MIYGSHLRKKARGDGVSGQTALHRCVASSKSMECLEFLLEHNADPNHADKLGLTPLFYAAYLVSIHT
jgi:ankyrin repeat protein